MSEYTVGLLYPRRGPAGLFGPSCLSCTTLAADDINARGGILGRELAVRPIDSATGVDNVTREVESLLAAGAIDAIVGWHTSDVRRALSARLDLRVPYVYTALYEGGESTAGVFLTGETPEAQIRPALEWLRRERGVGRWWIVGSDYLWARDSAKACARFARGLGHDIAGAAFVPVGTDDFSTVIAEIARSGADGVLMLLLGQDAVEFNRAFAAAGLDDAFLRYSPLMDEHMLMASGADATGDLFASAGYFDSVVTSESMEFGAHYFGRFGPNAITPTSMGESCFEGMLLLESLLTTARSTDVRDIMAGVERVRYDGARGTMGLRDGHTRQTMYLAQAEGCDFDVIDQL
ncbi:substrate-binding domain-containing protein [Tsukamurella sp. NPDC003166]|uniref:substrate-binding domain-containing protein n=1 Tax=Tsukamurella sp. NPDC003166 TaxID=3154444 RepID=UPI0033B0D96C